MKYLDIIKSMTPVSQSTDEQTAGTTAVGIEPSAPIKTCAMADEIDEIDEITTASPARSTVISLARLRALGSTDFTVPPKRVDAAQWRSGTIGFTVITALGLVAAVQAFDGGRTMEQCQALFAARGETWGRAFLYVSKVLYLMLDERLLYWNRATDKVTPGFDLPALLDPFLISSAATLGIPIEPEETFGEFVQRFFGVTIV